MNLGDLGLIGNCQISALVDRWGSLVWSCLPRFDSPPVFGALLDAEAGGRFMITSASGQPGKQRYLPNSNVLETRFDEPSGSFRVLDFAPRFYLFERIFRPTKLVRIVEPLSGTPRIRVLCDPVLGWSRKTPLRDVGSHHITYRGFDAELRLTTDAALSYLDGEPFALTNRKHFVLAWGAPVEESLAPLCDRFLQSTLRYWQRWVKHCVVPAMYQDEVIRSALALKLHCYEDTGAIVAAIWRLTHTLPADNAAAALPAADRIVGNLVSAVTVEQGAVHVTFGNQANGAIKGKTLTLRPAVVEDAPVVPVAWVCAGASAPAPMTVHGTDRSSVAARFLPLNCR